MTLSTPDVTPSASPASRLDGRVALVTGAGSGIGRAAALAFARAGARVVLAGRRAAELDDTANAVTAGGGEALAVPADVSRDADVRALVDRAVAAYGRLDCAFNNAGVEGAWAPAHEADDAEFERVVGTNLRGAWLCLKYELAALYAGGRGGAVVATSSFLALGASPNTAIDAASKAGLDALMRAAALEAGPRGVRLNTVRPGVIDTPMFRRAGSDEVARPLVAHTPLGRLGAPEDVADAAV